MDYWSSLDVHVWSSLDECLLHRAPTAAIYFLTTKTNRPYFDATLRSGDYLVFGRETKGLPEPLLRQFEDQLLKIPMTGETRSLNLATSVGIVLFEGMRQLAFSSQRCL